MFFRHRLIAVALPVALVTGLSGCSVLQSPADAPLTGIAACALGHTWKADLDDLAAQVLTELQNDGVAVTAVVATGEQSLEWGTNSQVVLTTDYVLTITTTPATGQVLTIVETHSGTATGAAYINGEVAIPRTWDGTGVSIETVADNNGAPVEEITISIPATTFDDAVGLELTCNGGELTIHPRGSSITQKWSS
jgi:hypothetical protein